MIMVKKGHIYPIKKKIPLILLLNLFGILIISHFWRFVNIFSEFYSIAFREVKKSLPKREPSVRTKTVGAGAHDSPLQMNGSLGSSKAPTPTEFDISFKFCVYI